MLKIILSVLFAGFLAVSFLGCQKEEGAAEKTGATVDNAVESTQKNVEKAVDSGKEKLDKAAESLDD